MDSMVVETRVRELELAQASQLAGQQDSPSAANTSSACFLLRSLAVLRLLGTSFVLFHTSNIALASEASAVGVEAVGIWLVWVSHLGI